MGALAEQGIGVVYATSDIKEVMTAADRILVMSAGRITGDFRRARPTKPRWWPPRPRACATSSAKQEASIVTAPDKPLPPLDSRAASSIRSCCSS